MYWDVNVLLWHHLTRSGCFQKDKKGKKREESEEEEEEDDFVTTTSTSKGASSSRLRLSILDATFPAHVCVCVCNVCVWHVRLQALLFYRYLYFYRYLCTFT